MNTNVSIVFCTCDKYEDLWDNFFHLFRKYWPEFDGEIIFNTDTKRYAVEGLNIVYPETPHENFAWSNMLAHCLKACTYDKVLIVLDDFYLKAPVDHEAFLKTLQAMDNDPSIISIAYQTQPGACRAYDGLEGFDVRKHFALYAMNASLTLYRRDFLLSMLKDGENAWQFEVNATVRSWLKPGTFLCRAENEPELFPYDGGGVVRHGQYIRKVKEYFETVEGLTFSGDRKTIEDIQETSQSGSRLGKLWKYGSGALRSFTRKGLR